MSMDNNLGNDSSERDYYCSMKFRYLKVDLNAGTTYNCHAARPHPVNFVRLEQRPGDLFNTEINVLERQQMLDNRRNSSCEQNCWPAEDRGAVSPRMYQRGQEKTHSEVITTPEIIEITIGADCNLTCSYCCREYSTAWRRDIVNNGNYQLSDQYRNRYSANTSDLISLKVSQPEIKTSAKRLALLDEVKLLAPSLKKLIITGGEPLLDNLLVDSIEQYNLKNIEVVIYTGLGLSHSRFDRMINKLSKVPNLMFIISAESVNAMLEFNRYGIKWQEFLRKVQLLEQRKIKFRFQATLSCLTVHGFKQFYEQFKNHEIRVTFSYQPTMMAPYVLDAASKARLIEDIAEMPEDMRDKITKSIQAHPTEQQRLDLGAFLAQFTSRRTNISLGVYPDSFLEWLGLKHVV